MTLDELEAKVRDAVHPREIFGDDLEGNLASFRVICLPENNPGQERRAEAVRDALERFATFNAADIEAIARAEAVFRSLGPPDSPPLATLASARRLYTLVDRLAIGDVSDVYRARAEERDYVLKASRTADGAHHLELERAALAGLLERAGDTHYRHYLPTLAESFPVRDRIPKRVNVFLLEPGFFTLEQVHRRHPVLDGRHLAWIFKRLLSALGFAHRSGRVHGAIVPPHVLVHAEDHGLRLVGWSHSVESGQRILSGSAEYLSWYPPEVRKREPAVAATDLFLAACCIVYLAGGDAQTGTIPESLPRAFAAFLRSCLLEGPRMRPDDAWTLLDEFNELLEDLYGPPRYHRLVMP